jgi:hypothetical protein
MKSKLLLSLLLATVAGAASADTFVVSSEKGTTSDEPGGKMREPWTWEQTAWSKSATI